jgi:hypothetical protein
MPKETIERTETKVVEETHREDIIICDSCGMDESERDMSRFSSKDYETDLYFCDECLLEDNTSFLNSYVMSGEHTRKLTKSERKQLKTVIIYGLILPAILGGILSGISGILIGISLSFVLIIILFSMEEQAFTD